MSRAEADPATTVRSYIAALNRGNPDDIANHVSDGFVNEHTSTLGETISGREAYRARLAGFLGNFRELHYEIEQTIVEGQQVAVAYRMSARSRKRNMPRIWIGRSTDALLPVSR